MEPHGIWLFMPFISEAMGQMEQTHLKDVDELQKAYDKKLIWLVISEGWCGDAAHSLPVMNKMAELNPNIEMRVVLRDQHETLMNQFLTNGGKSIPKLIIYLSQLLMKK